MSKRLNEPDDEIDSKKHKNNDDNKSDADSPLQFFDDHVSFNYVHVDSDANYNIISELNANIPTDKLSDFNGLDHSYENGIIDNITNEFNNEQVINSLIPKSAEFSYVKHETQGLNDILFNDIPNNTNPPSMEIILSAPLNVINQNISSVNKNLKHELSESIIDDVDKIFGIDLLPKSIEHPLLMDEYPIVINCLQTTTIMDTNTCSIKNELNPPVTFTNDDISDIYHDSAKLTEQISIADIQNLEYNADMDNLPENILIFSDISPDPLEIENKNQIVTTSDSNRRKSKKRKSSEQNGEFPIKSDYKLRSSATKLETPPKIAKQSPPPTEKKASRRKTKSISAPEQEISPIVSSRRVSSRIKQRTSSDMSQKNLSTPIVRRSCRVSTPPEQRIECLDQTSSSPQIMTNSDDPGCWPDSVPEEMRSLLIEHGPIQLENFDFPRDDKHRCFSPNSYFVRTPDNRRIRRNWLVYSVANDAAFCFPCRIFAGRESNSSLAFGGCRNWKKIIDRLNFHARSLKHTDSVDQWANMSMANDLSKGAAATTVTIGEAMQLVHRLKQFAATKENKLYMLTKQLQWELERINKAKKA